VGTQLTKWIRFAIWSAFVVIGLLTFFYMAWIHTSTLVLPVLALLGAGAITIGLAYSDRYHRWISGIELLNSPRLTLYVFLGGAALRLGWWFVVPPVFFSDTLEYWSAAVRLVEQGQYSFFVDGYTLRAWRPPGYPFLLASGMLILGKQPWLAAFLGFCAYVATFLTVYRLAQMVLGHRAARGAVATVAFWPSTIAIFVNPTTEPVSLVFVALTTFAFLRSIDASWRWSAFAGVSAGYGALVQPSLLTLPVLCFLYTVIAPELRRRILVRSVVTLVFAAGTLMPWAVRNYRVFGTVVPVSTNGGDVFYRANNPNASGGFTSEGERDLGSLRNNEPLWNRTGFQWGFEWITAHPLSFFRIIPRKQALMLGEDAYGFEYTLNWPVKTNSRTYRILEIVANVWWFAFWLVMVAGLIRHRERVLRDPRLCFVILIALSVIAVHSIFESQSRHHMRIVGLLAVVNGLALTTRTDLSSS
jgi:4-amino-4-deoxy-L-arabinose transferase-like glycosyltransferase